MGTGGQVDIPAHVGSGGGGWGCVQTAAEARFALITWGGEGSVLAVLQWLMCLLNKQGSQGQDKDQHSGQEENKEEESNQVCPNVMIKHS